MTDNSKRDKVVAALREAGLQFVDTPGFSFITIKAQHNLSIVLREMTKRVRARNFKQLGGTFEIRYEFAGFTVRFDSQGRGGMGTRRYPLRKDGTIDVERLQGDIASFVQREESRREAAATVENSAKALEQEFKVLQEQANALSGASGSGMYIEVQNDGLARGRIRFKVSGHITPERAMFIIAAVAASSKGEST